MKALISFLIFSLTFNLQALEVDEKLTMRLLSVSKTKKTVLVNRGLEDGLVVGDHAKFFLTAGVIARAMVIKASPSRSIWSIYRIVDGTEIVENKVLNLKISTPLKVTGDPSKTFRSANVDVRVGSTDKIKIPSEELSDEDQDDLSSLEHSEEDEDSLYVSKGSFSDKTLEVWGLVNFNSLNGTSTQGNNEFTASGTALELTGGIEKYFYSKNNFLRNLSLSLLVSSRSIKGGVQNVSSMTWFEYGVAGDYHFYNSPFDYGKIIGYGGLSAGLGTVSAESTTTSGGSETTNPIEGGSSSFFSAGVGGKYYLKNGFGARAVLDFFQNSSTFSFSDNDEMITTLAGLRFRVGMSYRW